jgi:hypothetical protein
MRIVGLLNHFLWLKYFFQSYGNTMTQHGYAMKMLKEFGLATCNLVITLMMLWFNIDSQHGSPKNGILDALEDGWKIEPPHSNWPFISFVVNQMSRFWNHLQTLIYMWSKLLKYNKWMMNLNICSYHHGEGNELITFFKCILGRQCSWICFLWIMANHKGIKKEPWITFSSIKMEHVTMMNGSKKTSWLKRLLWGIQININPKWLIDKRMKVL